MGFFDIRSLWLYFLALIVIASCQFESDEVYEDTDRIPAIPPELEVLELSLDQDTIFLTEALLVRFSFDAGDNIIYEVNIVLDGVVRESFESAKGEFILDPNILSLGYHRLSLSVITNANSGSIADILGVEGYEFLSNEWAIYSLNRQNIPLQHSQSFTDSGNLIVHWDSCRYRDIEYTVERFLENNLGPLVNTGKRDVPSYVDPDFIGDQAYFQIYVSKKGETARFPWGYFTIEDDLQVPFFTLDENRFAIQWLRKPYTGNLSEYRIRDLDSNTDVVSVSGSDTLAYIDMYRFGQRKRFSIIPVPRTPNSVYESNLSLYTTNITCTIGTEIIPLGGMWNTKFFLTADDRIIYRDNLNVKAYDIKSNSVVDELFAVSPTNPNATYYNLSLSTSREEFCIFSLWHESIFYGQSDDLSNHETYMPTIDKWRIETRVLDGYDEIILTESNTGKWYFFSTIEGDVVDSLHINDTDLEDSRMFHPEFSADGRYYMYLTEEDFMKMYEFDGRNFIKLYETEVPWSGSLDRVILDPEDPEVLLYFDYENVYLRNVVDFSLISSVAFPGNDDIYIKQVDFKNRRFLAVDKSDTSVSVYDLDDGTLIIKVRVLSLDEIVLSDNTLIYTPGYRLDFTVDN